MKRAGFAAVLWILCAGSAYAASAIDLRQHPMGGKTRVKVSVGLYITNFIAIDETRENFEVGGYLTLKWMDPRLALPAGESSAPPRSFRLDQLWTPAIESANSISHRTAQYFLEADNTGTVTYTEKFVGELSNAYELRKFPFDTQELRFEFHPFLSAAREIQFAPRPLPSAINPEQHTELAAWTIEDLLYTTDNVTADGAIPEGSGASFQIIVRRRSGFYVWKIFVPLLLMTLIPMVVFWIDVAQFDWLLKIPMTMLLSMVAFEFAIARDLPRIGYLTLLDAVFLAGFTFCFLCIFEIATVFLLQERGKRPLAVKLHRAGRWGYPAVYFTLLLVLAIAFLA
jgi:neurotransmitter-gated ion-channel